MRVAIVFDNLGPYHLARLRGAASHVEVIAVEVSPQNTEYAWEKEEVPASIHYVALSEGTGLADDVQKLEQAIAKRLAPLKPDAVAVPGWSSLAALVILRWCVRNDIPAICMSESNHWDFERNPVVEFVKGQIGRYFSAGLVTSDRQADYLVALGLKRESIFYGYNAVDNDFFAKAAADVVASGKMPLVDGAPLPEAVRGRYFLVSCRFIEKKNLACLLRAYAKFRSSRGDDPDDWPLIILGDGELRAPLEQLRGALGLDRFVKMPGFKQRDELPLYYATAGAFVHPSTTEQWGLVVNEAVASGLPVAVSYRCGSTETLVLDGESGLVFDPFDDDAVTGALTRMAESGQLEQMAQRGRDLIADWGPERFGDGLAQAARYGIEHGAGKPGAIGPLMLSLALKRLDRQ